MDLAEASCETTPSISTSVVKPGFAKKSTHPLPTWLGATRGNGEMNLGRDTKKYKSRHHRESLGYWWSASNTPAKDATGHDTMALGAVSFT